MAHSIWNGAITFGLVTIPVKLLPAVRADEDVHFHYLHAKDQGRIKNVRRCEECGKDVPWSEIARGFEYEKGSFVIVEDDELKAMRGTEGALKRGMKTTSNEHDVWTEKITQALRSFRMASQRKLQQLPETRTVRPRSGNDAHPAIKDESA